jgi:hypothetical protein
MNQLTKKSENFTKFDERINLSINNFFEIFSGAEDLFLVDSIFQKFTIKILNKKAREREREK